MATRPSTSAILEMIKERPLQDEDFDIVIMEIGTDWKWLARKILPRAEVEMLIIEHQAYGPKHIMYEALVKWQQKTPEVLTVNNLITHLVAMKRQDVVEKINQNISDRLNSELEKGINTDVVLVCAGKDFPAHRNVLSAVSEYFKSLFDNSAKLSIEIPNISSEEMEIILPFLYKGKIKEVDDPSLLKKMLTTSHMLDCHDLFQYYSKKICQGLSCNNYLEVYNLAELYNDEEMTKSVLDFLDQHFTEVIKRDDFLTLTASQLQKIIKQLQAGETLFDDIFKGLLRWSEVAVDRQDTLKNILSIFDLQGISAKEKVKDIHDFTLLKKLLRTSHMLECVAMVEFCTKKLCEGLSCSNCLEVYRLFEVYNDEETMKTVLNFLGQQFTTISQTEEFLKLTAPQLQKIIKQLQAGEALFDDIFKGLLRWSEARVDRQGTLKHILSTFDLQEISIEKKIKDMQDFALLKKLLKTSHMLECVAMFEFCTKKLCEGLSCSNGLELYKLFEAYNDEETITIVLNFLNQNFTAISQNEDFLGLTVPQLQKIIQHLQLQTNKTSTEDDIIKGLLRWSKAGIDRQVTLTDILTTLDLQLVSNEYLKELLQDRQFVKNNPNSSRLLFDEVTTRLLPLLSNAQIRYISTTMGPPSAYNSKFFCCGKLLDENKYVFSTYDVKLNQWATKTIPFEVHCGMPMVWFKDHVYIFGSREYESPSAKVIKYNPTTNTHVCKETLSTPVSSAGAGVLNASIIVVNGRDKQGNVVTTVQCYNPYTRACRIIGSTNDGHDQPHVLSYSNHLYCLSRNYTNSNCVECYDTEVDHWTKISSIPGQINISSATIFAEKLWVRPKWDENIFQVYDFLSDVWVEKQMEESPNYIYVLHSVKIDGKELLLVSTGRYQHVYDPELDQRRALQACISDISPNCSNCVTNC